MGAVYEVVHELTGRHHALKLLYESLAYDGVVLARFAQEARAATSIRSPHVVEVTDMGNDGASPYLVMELLEGEDLGSRMSRRGSITRLEAVDIIGQACNAVAHAHAIGVIHRDLKPENLFILPGDFVKVLDFGIAKLRRAHDAVGDGITRDGSLLGTPEYMSPEQITVKADLDYRSDIYSLGVILYEMLAGRLPYEAEQLTELAVLIVTSDAVPLPQYVEGLPDGLAQVVHDAMARSPADRPTDCREFARRLKPYGTPESFAWVDDVEELDPVHGTPSIRAPHATPRLAVRTARSVRASATPNEASPRNVPTLDGPPEPPADETPPAAASSRPPPALPRSRLARGLGAALLIGIGATLAVVFGWMSADPPTAPVDAEGSGTNATADGALPTERPAPPTEMAAVDSILSALDDAGRDDAGRDDAGRDEPALDASARADAAARETQDGGDPRRVWRPTSGQHIVVDAGRPASTPNEDGDEAPAPHTPLKTNPFRDLTP